MTKEELQERAQLVRALEALCKIEYPTPDELNGRIAMIKKVGVAFGLREMRSIRVEGPRPQHPTAPARPPTIHQVTAG